MNDGEFAPTPRVAAAIGVGLLTGAASWTTAALWLERAAWVASLVGILVGVLFVWRGHARGWSDAMVAGTVAGSSLVLGRLAAVSLEPDHPDHRPPFEERLLAPQPIGDQTTFDAFAHAMDAGEWIRILSAASLAMVIVWGLAGLKERRRG